MPTGTDVMEVALRDFLRAAHLVPAAGVAELLRTERRRPMTLEALQTHPDFLLAVSSGAWSIDHSVLARRAARAARRLAREQLPWRHRRRYARALEAAALAVLATAGGISLLPPALVTRIASPWERASAGVRATA